ncbi:MAG: DNA polymerase III subunit delta [Methylococcales bacterium]|nr:DNA polymerase III subunit delta [Methylococcales bacterium]
MRLKLGQLEGALKNKLAAIYLVTGDEPLQVGEAADAIRLAVKKEDYLTREVLSTDTSGFDWNELGQTADSFSIFADKKLIDLRIPSGKPGKEGAKALVRYCQSLPEDTILLITSSKLDKSSLNTKWFKAIEQAGIVIQIWPLDGADLIQWLQQRAQKRGLQIEIDGIKALASRVEGNLLAASQEIEKLFILHGNSAISMQSVEDAVADSARFDVFKLTDCVLSGRVTRAIKILNGLKAEGIVAPVIVWALAREIRLLINITMDLKQGQNKQTVFKNHRLWDKRQQLISSALSRMKIKQLQEALVLSSQADRQIKGQEAGDCWETLLSVCVLFRQTT